ncbi:MAG: DUF1028 domain-containing protein, partial [Bacteroidota bacterium]
RFFLAALALIFNNLIFSQDTFSIVAVDTTTGEIGSAGASCIDASAIAGGVLIISDILPGRGAIHTQALWNPANQANARSRMEAGDTPQEIMDWLADNDVQGNSSIRQYGAVAFGNQGEPQAAAFTGFNCMDYKNHNVGSHYAIQGNILLGQQILDSMEVRFLSTPGSLAEKLMAALQGANVPGADTRCLIPGVSSLSAFIRVAKTGDTTGTFYLNLNVPKVPTGVEPIDSIQILFDAWLATTGAKEKIENQPVAKVYPNPAGQKITVEWHPKDGLEGTAFLTDLDGRELCKMAVKPGQNVLLLPASSRGKVLLFFLRDQAGMIVFSEKLVTQP